MNTGPEHVYSLEELYTHYRQKQKVLDFELIRLYSRCE